MGDRESGCRRGCGCPMGNQTQSRILTTQYGLPPRLVLIHNICSFLIKPQVFFTLCSLQLRWSLAGAAASPALPQQCCLQPRHLQPRPSLAVLATAEAVAPASPALPQACDHSVPCRSCNRVVLLLHRRSLTVIAGFGSVLRIEVCYFG